MEIKVNKEIMDYTENVYFGLSMRQFLCSALAVGVAVGVYFLTKDHLSLQVTGWLCILGAAPFAAAGWVKYHGMTAGKLLITVIRSEILIPRELTFRDVNFYDKLLEGSKDNVQHIRNHKGPDRKSRRE